MQVGYVHNVGTTPREERLTMALENACENPDEEEPRHGRLSERPHSDG